MITLLVTAVLAVVLSIYVTVILRLPAHITLRWRVVALAVPPIVAWAFYGVYVQRMDPLCREDDECALRALAPAAVAVVASAVSGIAAIAAWRRAKRP
jgi:uncharacterized membrane protein